MIYQFNIYKEKIRNVEELTFIGSDIEEYSCSDALEYYLATCNIDKFEIPFLYGRRKERQYTYLYIEGNDLVDAVNKAVWHDLIRG